MARKLDAFPDDRPSTRQKYRWEEWTDGSVWEIRQGIDYDVETENMRVNLHMKADAQSQKVRTKKVRDEDGEGLVFQFLDSEEEEEMNMLAEQQARVEEYRRSKGSALIPADGEVTPFKDEEAAYLDWIDRHPFGYVVNTERTPRPSYLKLHSAKCPHISNPREPGAYTERQYIKFCSTSRPALEQWAEEEIGGHLGTHCTCLRRS
jgi:hypothetical protein